MPDADGFAELHLREATLERNGLPNIPYPVPPTALESAARAGGELPLPLLLFGLQERSRDGEAPWRELEPAMARLAELLAPDDPDEVTTVAGDGWWLEIGPVDPDAPLVAIHRGDTVIAIGAARADGRLRFAIFRPLDAKSMVYLSELGQDPQPGQDYGPGRTNWDLAFEYSGRIADYYADMRGEAFLSRWPEGLGVREPPVPGLIEFVRGQALAPRPAAHVVAELTVHFNAPDEWRR